MSGQQEPRTIDITQEAYAQGHQALERLGEYREGERGREKER